MQIIVAFKRAVLVKKVSFSVYFALIVLCQLVGPFLIEKLIFSFCFLYYS